MIPTIKTVSLQGIDVLSVDVEVHMASGLPAFTIVGLPDKAVAESKERVRAALSSIGLSLPAQRITVNLAPADHVKEGSHYDLAIALGLLSAMSVIDWQELTQYYVIGELALDSRLRNVRGILPAALEASSRKMGIICPSDQGPEALWAGDIPILAPASLLALINHLKGVQILSRPQERRVSALHNYPDMADVKGQETAKRALEIAAAGGHNVLMIGPPGSGKSMLAQRFMGILPPLNAEEILETSVIHSVSGILKEGALCQRRPFRSPHYSASLPAMIGGGAYARPGEISLAHNGVLFLDEIAEMSKSVLEALRQPLEDGVVTVSRAKAHVTYPANFQFIAAMNPCPCGYFLDLERQCTKVPACAQNYQGKLSGPMLDRIDIFIHVPQLSVTDLDRSPEGESSEAISKRIEKARKKQKDRYKKLDISIHTNAGLPSQLMDKNITIADDAKECLLRSVEKLHITARGYYRILRVALTISDLEGHDKVLKEHILEALSYRQLPASKNI